MAEALIVALALMAVVAFVRTTSGPAHPVAVSTDAGRAVHARATVPTTTVPVSSAPSVDAQVTAWWSATGEPRTAALIADLDAVEQSGPDATAVTDACTALIADTASAASAPTAPSPSIEREWQLAVSTSTRASAACQTGRITALAGDVQPAMYTIRDLSAQIRPYLFG